MYRERAREREREREAEMSHSFVHAFVDIVHLEFKPIICYSSFVSFSVITASITFSLDLKEVLDDLSIL